MLGNNALTSMLLRKKNQSKLVYTRREVYDS